MIVKPERWEHHLLAARERFTAFWKDYFTKPREVAYILAEGFDPRMCEALGAIRDSWDGNGHALVLHLSYSGTDAKMEQYVKKNRDRLGDLLASATTTNATINVRATAQRAEGARQTGLAVQQFLGHARPRDVIVDINAMPKSVALSALTAALKYSDAHKNERVNVHVVVAHNPHLDDRMKRTDIQRDPFLLPGFIGDFESEDNKAVNIWIPVLGPGQDSQLTAIKAEWNPVETCPAVPSPSVNPRKGDDLLTNYQDILLEEGRFVPRNVLRVSERDPFEAYHELVSTIAEYGKTYKLLDGCKVLLSSHSSKLLSVACLLAAYDAHERDLCDGVSIAFVEAYGHGYDPEEATPPPGSELFEMWLAGDPYIS